MQLGKILLPVQDRPDMDAIANTAFTVADRFGAQVEGLYAYRAPSEQVQLYYEAAGPVYDDSLLKEAEQRSEAAQNRAREIFDQLSRPYASVTTAFLTMAGGAAHGVARRGRVADLTIIGTARENETGSWLDIRDAAIFQTGRPVLVVPPGPVSNELGKTIVIAWKDSVEATRAVAAAEPFLANAKTVHLVSVGRDAVTLDELKDVQAYLSLHAADVKAAIVGADKANAAEPLLEKAVQYSDALLVMGAYSHWRWTEWVFGGVTEYMLRKTTVPILMTH